MKPLGGNQELRTSTLLRHRSIRGESHVDFLGESEGSLPPHDSFQDAGEAINDLWSMFSKTACSTITVNPESNCWAREESFPFPLKYIDVSTTNCTNLYVKQEKRIDDYWNVDGSRNLSDPWTGFTQFTSLEEKRPNGYMWSGERLTRKQLTSRPDHLWPEIWKSMGKHAKLKEKQKWSKEKIHLDNARKLRGIYFIDPEDKEYKETIKNARKKLETSVAPAMNYRENKHQKSHKKSMRCKTMILFLQTSNPRVKKLLLYAFEDKEAVIHMIVKRRSPTIRHVSRTHSVVFDWLFDRINLDPKIQIRYIDTKNQLADILTKGSFTRDEWNHILTLFNISHFQLYRLLRCDDETSSTRIRRRTCHSEIKAYDEFHSEDAFGRVVFNFIKPGEDLMWMSRSWEICDFAGDLEDSKSSSGGIFCVFGSHTFFPTSWMCKKQTAVFHSSTESGIISLDAEFWLDGLLSVQLWDFIVFVLGNMTQTTERTERLDFLDRSNKSQGKINTLNYIDCSFKCPIRTLRSFIVCVWGQRSSDEDDH